MNPDLGLAVDLEDSQALAWPPGGGGLLNGSLSAKLFSLLHNVQTQQIIGCVLGILGSKHCSKSKRVVDWRWGGCAPGYKLVIRGWKRGRRDARILAPVEPAQTQQVEKRRILVGV